MTELSGIKYAGRENNFERDYAATIAEMVALPGNGLKFPPMFIAMCGETGKTYLYNKNNTVDATLGKWREIVIVGDDGNISVGGDPADPNGGEAVNLSASKPVILTQAEYDALYATKDDPDTE